ncbi:hypothetical protein [Streptomyces sp. TLI_55]|nr:hypothetical protein [Streptomyces sp. TLI_55]
MLVPATEGIQFDRHQRQHQRLREADGVDRRTARPFPGKVSRIFAIAQA